MRAFRGMSWYPPGRKVFRFDGDQFISQFDTWRSASRCQACELVLVDGAHGSWGDDEVADSDQEQDPGANQDSGAGPAPQLL